MIIDFLENEYWYGGIVKNGTNMPISNQSVIEVDTTVNHTPNQAMPLFISTKGRIIHANEGFKAFFNKGKIELDDKCTVSEPYGNLKAGYLQAVKKFFPFSKGTPAKEFFSEIIYNSWIELTFYQNEKDIMKYARGILENGMPTGVLMIDDGWSEYYGNWTFHSGKFPDAKGMLEKLHDMGFKVMVWVCPFISPDTLKFRDALSKDILIKTEDGELYILHWWNGYSAVLDMSNPNAVKWLREQLDLLLEMGVDGFKFDAGDSFFYSEDCKTYKNTTPNEQSVMWEEFGEKYRFNEYRAAFNAGGKPLLQRLCDKQHSWNEEGVGGLVPDSLLQGITGHPFCCPDMIGGGEYVNFYQAVGNHFDEDLFVRHCQIAALMPTMQFSAAPYRVLTKENFKKVKDCLELREKFIGYIMKLVDEVTVQGEPIIRYMSYEFPNEPVEEFITQFMLGSKVLVAPICSEGQTGRYVYLPKGKWIKDGEKIESDGKLYWIEETDGLIYFEME